MSVANLYHISLAFKNKFWKIVYRDSNEKIRLTYEVGKFVAGIVDISMLRLENILAGTEFIIVESLVVFKRFEIVEASLEPTI